MSNDTAQDILLQELSRFFRRFNLGGDLAPIEDRDEWEKLVKSQALKNAKMSHAEFRSLLRAYWSVDLLALLKINIDLRCNEGE